MTVIYPGSFDPFTLGHLDIVIRALGMFDGVIIVVMSNPGKHTSRTVEQKIEIIKRSVSSFSDRIKIIDGTGKMAVDIAKEYDGIIVKGIRNAMDFDYEKIQAEINGKFLNPPAETIFLPTHHDNISSSAVRELVRYGRRDAWKKMVSAYVYDLIEKYYGD